MDNNCVLPLMRETIRSCLAVIEAKHNITILYACESGSRGWGFASPDSDYDVRFIYVHRLSWYLQISTPRDVIEEPITSDLDVNGWELRKALGLLKKGNATLMEWMNSPIVYRAEESFISCLNEAARQIYRPEYSFHHYLHMARKNYHQYLRNHSVDLKKYFYSLRPLLAAIWIEQGKGFVPMPFQKLVDEIVTNPSLNNAINQLLIQKKLMNESKAISSIPIISQFISQELTRLELISLPKQDPVDLSILDRVFLEGIAEFADNRT